MKGDSMIARREGNGETHGVCMIVCISRYCSKLGFFRPINHNPGAQVRYSLALIGDVVADVDEGGLIQSYVDAQLWKLRPRIGIVKRISIVD